MSINPSPFQFSDSTLYPAGYSPYGIAVSDFNGDGQVDIATANLLFLPGTPAISLLLGNGAGGFTAASNSLTTATLTNGFATIVAADFNRDSKVDLAAADPFQNRVAVLLGIGDGTFQAPTSIGVGATPFVVAKGDLNGDGLVDLVTANQGNNTVSVALGNGSGGFAAAIATATGAKPGGLGIADFNGDGKQDVVVANEDGNTVSLLLGTGNGALTAGGSIAVGSKPTAIAVGDLNGDGRPDVAVANGESDTVSILLNTGIGTLASGVSFAAGDSPGAILAQDLNGDANLDLITSNRSGGDVSVLLGNGNGTFQSPVKLGIGTAPLGLATGDFNRDGKLDLATATTATGAGTTVVRLNQTTLIVLNPGVSIDGSRERLAAITVDLAAGTLAINGTTLSTSVLGYSNVIGTQLNDRLTGNEKSNQLEGQGGDDSLNGQAGNDRYLFDADNGLGSDGITDISGTDAIDFSVTTTQAVSLNLGSTRTQAVNGNLRLTLATARQIEQAIGGSGADRLLGNPKNNLLAGGDGDDRLTGLGGKDVLLGNNGNDRLLGGKGDDELTGGLGLDRLKGGKGNDSFIFDTGAVFDKTTIGLDQVVDFGHRQDLLVLDRSTFTKLGRRISFAAVETVRNARRSQADITYVTGMGRLFYNENGNKAGFGTGGQFANLKPNTLLTGADFVTQA